MSFLGITGFFQEGLVAQKLEQVAAKTHAGFKITGWAQREVQVAAAAKLGRVQSSMVGCILLVEFSLSTGSIPLEGYV
jgi:hypothetical protein